MSYADDLQVALLAGLEGAALPTATVQVGSRVRMASRSAGLAPARGELVAAVGSRVGARMAIAVRSLEASDVASHRAPPPERVAAELVAELLASVRALEAAR